MIRITGQMGTKLYPIDFKSFVFSGGEVSVKITGETEYSRYFIRALLQSSNDVFELLMVTDALRRIAPNTPINLEMPYIPYARQDRVCDHGEALSIRVFADLINAQNYSSVTVWDAHSEVSLALLNKCANIKPSVFVTKIPGIDKISVLVSPDAGANKKVFELAYSLGGKREVLRADKTRDVKTGQITGTVVYCEDLAGEDVLIVDDIGDGMRTFIELGKKLKEKNAGKVILFVTHAICSKGVDVLNGSVDILYSANLWEENINGRNEFGILRNLDTGARV